MIPGERPPAGSAPIAREKSVAGSHLTYRDSHEVEWSVVEVTVDRAAVPGARGTHCLLFSRRDCIRRVWEYPAGWRQLDAAALESLSWRR